MAPPKMHRDELDIGLELVHTLVESQFPEWADLDIEPVHPKGTDNALFRLGDDMVARLPRLARTSATLKKEVEWLPRLAPFLPLRVPLPLANGAPEGSYPFVWSIYTWLDGDQAIAEHIADQAQAANDLARFISALRSIDSASGPPPGEHNFFRGASLWDRDERTRACIASLDEAIDTDGAAVIWEDALAASHLPVENVWIHGDLDSRNVLAQGGRLVAVIDWGGLAVGDPACDAMVAWKMFSGESRTAFRSVLKVDDATWTRARGWAVSQAVIALDYYTAETNPTLVAEARRWLTEAINDL
jgi:aminoglycoside phosphotransferase (APT) family kinase protein